MATAETRTAADRAIGALEETLRPVAPPLEVCEGGRTLRVTGTRIPLERVVYAFNAGRTPQEIVASFPTLTLTDVHSIIAYYLRNREAVDDYVEHRRLEEERIRLENEVRFPSEGLRERLLARRAKNG